MDKCYTCARRRTFLPTQKESIQLFKGVFMEENGLFHKKWVYFPPGRSHFSQASLKSCMLLWWRHPVFHSPLFSLALAPLGSMIAPQEIWGRGLGSFPQSGILLGLRDVSSCAVSHPSEQTGVDKWRSTSPAEGYVQLHCLPSCDQLLVTLGLGAMWVDSSMARTASQLCADFSCGAFSYNCMQTYR